MSDGVVSSTGGDCNRGAGIDYNRPDMSTVNVSPIASMPPLQNDAGNSSARSTSRSAPVADAVQLTPAGEAAATLSPEEILLDETDSYAEILKAAANDDPVARSLLDALNSIPPPQVA
jgi:hypothetical protein